MRGLVIVGSFSIIVFILDALLLFITLFFNCNEKLITHIQKILYFTGIWAYIILLGFIISLVHTLASI